jgi:Carbohydrate family 9 binding domain-like/Domain of unknown function (DUF4091)
MRLVKILFALSCSAPLVASAATVSVAGSTFKVRKSQAPLAARSAVISAAKNEFEAFQILVTGPATGVVATASALSNGTATVGPVRLYREALIQIANQSASDSIVAAGDWLPDALVPDVDEIYGEKRNAFVGFDVPAGETRAIWAEVRVPEAAAAGLYSGSVSVTFAEGSATVPVTLTVYDFALPTKPSLKTAWGLYYGGLPTGHGISATSADFPTLRGKYDQLALDHRLTLSRHDDGDKSTAHFDAAYGPYVAGTAPTQAPGAALTQVEVLGQKTDSAYMKTVYDDFVSKGWQDKLFQYTCDEPPATCAWTDIPVRTAAAKAANPAFRTLVTANIGEIQDAEAQYGISIQPNLDVVVPIINQLWDKPGQRFAGSQVSSYQSFLAGGPRKEVWTYQSCMSHGCGGTSSYFTGWPSYAIDASAVRNRAMQWLDFLYGVTGELYFESVFAYQHDPWNNQWDFHGNGDGTFFYPGTPAKIGGTTHVPVASMRLKLIREGMEDFEYLKLLSALGDAAMAQREAQTLFPSAYQTEADPDALMAARARIAQRIVDLKNGVPALVATIPYQTGVVVDGNAADFTAAPINVSGAYAGSDVNADVRLAFDDDYLYASWVVRDATVVVNQGGRDGETWNGDSVELFLDVANDKALAVDANHYHLVVNANGDLTDERGNAGAWDRGWTSNAVASVARSTTGYTVELKVPWASLGASPCSGLALGVDVAVNDVDVAGAMPKQFDWARLTRFAQPSRWGTAKLDATLAGSGFYVIHKANGPVVVDGNLAEFARAPNISLDAAAAAAKSDNKASARLLYDATNLYVAFRVKDAALRINQGGRDGETWNGDGVEVLLDLLNTKTAAPDADDRHLVVNANGDLTDEKGNAGAWLRSWASNAKVAVAGVPGSYGVEMAIPWSTLGIAAPATGKEIGLDLANNDLDADLVLRQFDWAGLTRFAQPKLWRRARFDSRVPACSASATPAPAW